MKNWPIKTRAGFFIALLFVPLLAIAPLPHTTLRAEALSCGDTPANPCFSVEENPAVLTSVAATAGSTGTSLFIKQVLDGLAWAVAKAAIQSITKSMVNWINSGFNGSPAFVTDLNRTMQNLSDGVANDFFNALERNTGVNVRSPFQDQVTQLLRNTYYGSTAKMAPTSGYNLNRYSTNPQAFLNGRFSNGGFDAWFAALSNDQNNPLGAFHAQQNALESQIASFRDNQLHELDWGKGFLSWRGDCIAKKSSTDLNTDILSGVSLSAADSCASYEIKTPGSVVENALGITVTSPLRQLELANSVNEIVGALASQLVNQVLGGTGLSGLSSPSAGGGSSYLSQATNPSQYSQDGSLANGFIAQIATDQNNTNTYLSGWQKIQSLAQSCTSSDPAVADARAKADANVARANSVISALRTISSEATAAINSTNTSAGFGTVSADYQKIISNGSIINPQDAQDASKQSDPKDSSSLYSKLTALGCSAR